MKTNQELKKQTEELFQGILSIGRYTSIIKAMDDNIYNLACSYDSIDASHPKAATMKQTIEDLVNLNALLLEGFGEHSEKLEDMADELSRVLI